MVGKPIVKECVKIHLECMIYGVFFADHYKNMCRYEMIMSVASISGMFLIWVIIPLILMTVMYIKIGYILRYKVGELRETYATWVMTSV